MGEGAIKTGAQGIGENHGATGWKVRSPPGNVKFQIPVRWLSDIAKQAHKWKKKKGRKKKGKKEKEEEEEVAEGKEKENQVQRKGVS